MATLAYKSPFVSASYVIAGQRCAETLLNCYCREVGISENSIRLCRMQDSTSWPLSIRSAFSKKEVLEILMERIDAKIIVAVEEDSPTANFIYTSSIYCKVTGQPWSQLDWRSLAQLIIQDLAIKHGQEFNAELLAQIEDSVNVTTAILEETREGALPLDPLLAYLSSEQSLIYGHPFHPAPKSRQGFNEVDLYNYSPEFGQGFSLHYFAVHKDFIYQRSTLDEACTDIIARQAPEGLIYGGEYYLVPSHPWQAKWLLDNPLVKSAIDQGKLKDLGVAGDKYFPTSSVRTLYQPGNPYFFKFSLHVRLTNCVRKNAVYELESALQVNQIMTSLIDELATKFPGVAILEEPAFLSVDLKDENAIANKEVTEGFGLILRKGFGQSNLKNGVTPLLAGSLFGNHSLGRSYLQQILSSLCSDDGKDYEQVMLRWFSSYVQQVMYPILECYFAYGVIFEPHLQNVVIGLSNHWPTQVFLRDFEGVKLLPEQYPEHKLSGISARARESLWYSAEQGWNRISYCLFVNNFCEAIHQLSFGNPQLEQLLWAEVRGHLEYFQMHYGTEQSKPRIDGLLNGEAFPTKANLSNRFMKQPDKVAGYMSLANPLGMHQ